MASRSSDPAEVARDLPHGDVAGLLTVAAALAGARAAHVALVGRDGLFAVAGTTPAPCLDERLHALGVESVTRHEPLIVANLALRAIDHADRATHQAQRQHRLPAEPHSHIVLPLRLSHAGMPAVLLIQDVPPGRTDQNTVTALDTLAAELVRKFETNRLAALRRDTAESRYRFVDMLIHDAKGVLACLAWQLEARKASDSTADGSAALAKASVTELLDTLDDIGRIHQQNLMDFEPQFALHDLESWFSALCDRERTRANRAGIALKTYTRLNQHHFNTDLRLLDRIAQNLCANALAFSRPGDTVVLAIEQLGSGGFTLSVEDEGPGIPDEDLSRIFEPYFTRRRAGGSGLGLSICRSAALKLGGRLDYTPRPQKGSRFAFTLPPGTDDAANDRASVRRPRDLISQIGGTPRYAEPGMSLRRPVQAAVRARTASLRIAARSGAGTDRSAAQASLDRIDRVLVRQGVHIRQPSDRVRLTGEVLNEKMVLRRGNHEEPDRVDRNLAT